MNLYHQWESIDVHSESLGLGEDYNTVLVTFVVVIKYYHQQQFISTLVVVGLEGHGNGWLEQVAKRSHFKCNRVEFRCWERVLPLKCLPPGVCFLQQGSNTWNSSGYTIHWRSVFNYLHLWREKPMGFLLKPPQAYIYIFNVSPRCSVLSFLVGFTQQLPATITGRPGLL